MVENDVVDRIYEASVVPELWSAVLRDFAHLAECRESVVVATNGESYRWIGSSPQAEQLAVDHYSFEGGAERSRRLTSRHHPGFLTDFDVFTDEEMASIPLFTDLLIPSGYGRGIATAIQIPTGETIIIDAEGDIRHGRFRRDIIDRLDALRPHYARAAMISARLAFERAQTAVETLAGIGMAACAVGSTGRVLVANAQFADAASSWTTRGGDTIALLDTRADKQLALSLSLIRSHQGVRSIALAATERTPPAVLHVVPIRRSAHDLFSQAAAILVLTSASNAVTQETALLRALFDLTPVEASVAARVAAGQSLEGIAIADAKSRETVRNQLKTVLAKTGCRRQPDLARLLTSLVPPRAAN